MKVTLADLQKYHPTLKTNDLSRYVKPTEQCKVVNGFLYSLYDTESIKTAMENKRKTAMTATKLCNKHRVQSLTNVKALLHAVEQIEGELELCG